MTYQATGAPVSIAKDRIWDWLTIQQLPTRVSIGDVSTFAAPNQTFVRVPYSSILFDVHNEFDTTLSQFHPSNADDYMICASIFSVGSDITEELHMYKNRMRERGVAFEHSTAGGCRVLRWRGGPRPTSRSRSCGIPQCRPQRVPAQVIVIEIGGNFGIKSWRRRESNPADDALHDAPITESHALRLVDGTGTTVERSEM